MVKSKVARVLIKLVLIFVAITIYFYFQHPVQYRCTNLKAVFPVGDMTLVLDDIRISDLDEDKLSGRYRGGEIPWIYRMILEANLPMDWTIKLTDIVAFYSRPPRTGGDVAHMSSSRESWSTRQMLRNPVSTDDSRRIGSFLTFDMSVQDASAVRGGNFTIRQQLLYGGIVMAPSTLMILGKQFVLSITDQAN
ncbi:MAG: hypothetical protein ACOX4Q_00690 [Syntrophomonadales bacterium]